MPDATSVQKNVQEISELARGDASNGTLWNTETLRIFGGAPKVRRQQLLKRRPIVRSVVVKLAQRDPRLAGEIYERCGEEAEGNDKKHRNPPFVLDAKHALTKATITRSVANIAPIDAYSIALFNRTARCFRRGRSVLRYTLAGSSLPIVFRVCDLSTTRFIRRIKTEINAASAAGINAGAIACAVTCESWLTDGVSGIT